MSLDTTREENDNRLLSRLAEIRAGKAIDALAPFARAYLGLYLNVDEDLSRDERVRSLANDTLAAAVLDGFVASLQQAELPSPRQIGNTLGGAEVYPVGFVVLAGMDRLTAAEPEAALALPDDTLKSALCFHLANAAPGGTQWVDTLFANRPDLAARALETFWLALAEHGAVHLPGLSQFLSCREIQADRAVVILSLLTAWENCPKEILIRLLMEALRGADRGRLLALVRATLNQTSRSDVKRRMYWYAAGFLLAPEVFGQTLPSYVGRSKEKALPLLEFIDEALSDPEIDLELSPAALAGLLRVIGPAFPPVGDLGGPLDSISQKVVTLFERLGRNRSPEGRAALVELRRVRVMGICAAALDYAESLQTRAEKRLTR